jgi:hypothetical protein
MFSNVYVWLVEVVPDEAAGFGLELFMLCSACVARTSVCVKFT